MDQTIGDVKLIETTDSAFEKSLEAELQQVDEQVDMIETMLTKNLPDVALETEISTTCAPETPSISENAVQMIIQEDSDNGIVIANPNACDQITENTQLISTATITSPQNMSLGLISNYNSSSSDETSDSEPHNFDAARKKNTKRKNVPGTISTSSSSSSSDSSSDDDSSTSDSEEDSDDDDSSDSSSDNLETIEKEMNKKNKTRRGKSPLRVKGEQLLTELPPIEGLSLSISEKECIEIGKVQSIVDQLVLVESIQGVAALDLDTVLFLEKGNRTLGLIFDVLGQVAQPLYCVRFNSRAQIDEQKITIGLKVYCAPRSEHTSFVILNNLMTGRGSDASWKNDIEPDDKHLDYSDDEEERRARDAKRAERNKDKEPTKRQRPNCENQQRYSGNQRNFRGFNRGYQGSGGPRQYSTNQYYPNSNYANAYNNNNWQYNMPPPPIGPLPYNPNLPAVPGTSYINPYAVPDPNMYPSMMYANPSVVPFNMAAPPPPPPPPPGGPPPGTE